MNIEAARAAINAFNDERAYNDSTETDLIDLITDLCHLYAEDGSDPLPLLDMARQHFEEEHGEAEPVGVMNPINGFWFCPGCMHEWTDTQESRSVCPKCGLFVRVDDEEEREDPLQEVKDFMAWDAAKAAVPPLTKPYTVLLLYPDYIADNYGEDTYLAHVEADNIDDALTEAQLEAHKVNNFEGNHNDFAPLFICEGHIQNMVGAVL